MVGRGEDGPSWEEEGGVARVADLAVGDGEVLEVDDHAAAGAARAAAVVRVADEAVAHEAQVVARGEVALGPVVAAPPVGAEEGGEVRGAGEGRRGEGELDHVLQREGLAGERLEAAGAGGLQAVGVQRGAAGGARLALVAHAPQQLVADDAEGGARERRGRERVGHAVDVAVAVGARPPRQLVRHRQALSDHPRF